MFYYFLFITFGVWKNENTLMQNIVNRKFMKENNVDYDV